MPWEGLLLPLYILPVVGIILLIQSAALAIDKRITRARDGNVARFSIILGFVLLGSVVYLPLIAELIDAVSGERDGMAWEAGSASLPCSSSLRSVSLRSCTPSLRSSPSGKRRESGDANGCCSRASGP